MYYHLRVWKKAIVRRDVAFFIFESPLLTVDRITDKSKIPQTPHTDVHS